MKRASSPGILGNRSCAAKNDLNTRNPGGATPGRDLKFMMQFASGNAARRNKGTRIKLTYACCPTYIASPRPGLES